MRYKFLVLALLGTCLSPMASAALTLEKALEDAYTKNPQLQAKRAEVRAVDENVPQALANWRPSIVVTNQLSRTKTKVSPFDKDVNRTNIGDGKLEDIDTALNFTTTIEQNLYRGGQTIAETEKAEFQILSARENLRKTEIDVLSRVTKAYTETYSAEKIYSLRVESLNILKKQLEAAQHRFDVGETTKTDVAQAESRLAEAEAALSQAKENVETTRAALYQLIGYHPKDSLGEPVLKTNILPATLSESQNIAQLENPDILEQFFQYRTALKEIEQRTGILLPVVTLQGQFNRNKPTFDKEEMDLALNGTNVNFTDTFSLALNIQIPLYESGGLRYAQIRQAKQTAGQQMYTLANTRRTVLQQTIDVWEKLESAYKQREAFKKQIEAASIAFEGAEQEVLVGSRTILELLDTQRELINAKIQFENVASNQIVLSYQLLQVIGRLTAQNLKLSVPYYNPDDHYNEVRNKWIGFGDPVPYTPEADNVIYKNTKSDAPETQK